MRLKAHFKGEWHHDYLRVIPGMHQTSQIDDKYPNSSVWNLSSHDLESSVLMYVRNRVPIDQICFIC